MCASIRTRPSFSISNNFCTATTIRPSCMLSIAKQSSMILRRRSDWAASKPRKLKSSDTFVPVLLSPWDKLDISSNLILCFGAIALSQATGRMADTGTLIYGEKFRRKTVTIRDHLARTRQIVEAIGAMLGALEQPPLILNRHCAVCDFQPRCRNLAVECDDLSLLSVMTGKERAKSNAKGVFTVTQLSYSYRPRWRKRTRADAEHSAQPTKCTATNTRNDHKLRALAIKKGQIHIVGKPSLKFDGIPTFFDVEAMPDRGFYYLVGLRFERDGHQVEHSFLG